MPEQKWADVSMDFIMGLPRSEQWERWYSDGGRPCYENGTSSTSEADQLLHQKQHRSTGPDMWERFHGLPRSIVSDRDPRFISQILAGALGVC